MDYIIFITCVKLSGPDVGSEAAPPPILYIAKIVMVTNDATTAEIFVKINQTLSSFIV